MGKLSNATKQKLYRERRDRDPLRRLEYLETSKQIYRNNQASGKRVLISELGKREQRERRKTWKVQQRKSRQAKSRVKAATLNTPPISPDLQDDINIVDFPIPDNSYIQGNEPSSAQAKRGRKKKNTQRASLNRKINKLEIKLQSAERNAAKYKKKLQRVNSSPTASTPRTRTKKLLRNFPANHEIKKTLDFHHVIIDQIRERYTKMKGIKEKRSLREVLKGRITKKYRMLKKMTVFGFDRCLPKQNKRSTTRGNRYGDKLKKMIQTFYERDDNSRITTGKKDTITKNKIKMQKRLLSHTLDVLHRKLLSEHPDIQVSYALFARLRPFWVCKPTVKDRDTTQCKQHENLEFVVRKLASVKILPTTNLLDLLKKITCSTENKSCMYSECKECSDSMYPVEGQYTPTEIVIYSQWITSKDGRFSHTEKGVKSSSLNELCEMFQTNLRRIAKHIFNIYHQYNIYRSLRNSLQPNECMIHIDFAENYLCKYGNEIQAVHFGGSHKQVTLHTGVLYMEGKEPMSFCTISDSRRHDPLAIWAYLEPVLGWIQEVSSLIHLYHFFSDGPATQYRQKKNFFLFIQKISEGSTWNFFEAAHGKGAPDGIGAALKRAADRLVSQGVDVTDAKTMYEKLKPDTTVKLFFVGEDRLQNDVLDVPAVPGSF